jgi:hypothetical protein
MIVPVTLPVVLLRRGGLLLEISRIDTLKRYFGRVFFSVVDILAIVPEARRNRDALDLDSAGPGCAASYVVAKVRSWDLKEQNRETKTEEVSGLSS